MGGQRRDDPTREGARGIRERIRKRLVPLLVGLVCCAVLFGPALSPGSGAVEERYPDDGPPADCIEGPDPAHVDGDGDRGRDSTTGTGVVGVVGVGDGATYRVDFRVPDARDRPFAVSNAPGAEVVEAHGFVESDGEFVWNGDDDPWVRVRVPDESDGIRRFVFARAGDALTGPVLGHDPDVSLRPADGGVIGAHYLVLGDVERHERSVGCQRITLVVPESVSETRLASPGRVIRVLAEAARRLDVGHAYRRVRVFVVPGGREGSVGGEARENEFVVYAGEDVRAARNVWIHEYVHTRQGYAGEESFRWFREASASYLSARLALESGLVTPRQYDKVLARGSSADGSTRRLSDGVDTRRTRLRGIAALSRLEGRLVERDRTVGDLLSWVNDRHGRTGTAVAQGAVERRVANWTGSRAAADRFRRDVRLAGEIEPDYASGPWWLPPRIRRVVPGFGNPLVRAGAGVGLVVALVAYYRDAKRADEGRRP